MEYLHQTSFFQPKFPLQY